MTQKKINLVELLKDCPKGMELDCTAYENVIFDYIDKNNDTFPIKCYIKLPDNKYTICKFTIYGSLSVHTHAKCVIYPKGKTTWEGFVPPCKFKDGDIIFTHANCLKVGVGNSWISIFKEKRNGGVATYVDYAEDGSDYYSDLDGDKALLCMESDILRQRFATEEEKQRLFDAIKANGYRWCEETKTLEKLHEPKLKVGDRITDKNKFIYRITEITDKGYKLHDLKNTFITFEEADLYFVKVVDVFDITTLKPFESRVLVRNVYGALWKPALYGFTPSKGGCHVVGGTYWKQCIPYEGNEHLLGKTDVCDDFYKTWE